MVLPTTLTDPARQLFIGGKSATLRLSHIILSYPQNTAAVSGGTDNDLSWTRDREETRSERCGAQRLPFAPAAAQNPPVNTTRIMGATVTGPWVRTLRRACAGAGYCRRAYSVQVKRASWRFSSRNLPRLTGVLAKDGREGVASNISCLILYLICRSSSSA